MPAADIATETFREAALLRAVFAARDDAAIEAEEPELAEQRGLEESSESANPVDEEPLQKDGESGRMQHEPMYRHKDYTHRFENEDGSFKIDKALYHRLTKKAIKSGADIRRPTAEILERLSNVGASAVTYGDVIFLKENATVSDVLEEIYHFYQNKNGINSDINEPMRSCINEIEAKEYLLHVASKYKIPEHEIELTRKQLAFYQEQLTKQRSKNNGKD